MKTTITLTVNPALSNTDQKIPVNAGEEMASLGLNATGFGNSVPVYSCPSTPTNGLSFGPGDGLISGTPTVAGVTTYTITASDGATSATATVEVTVSARGDARDTGAAPSRGRHVLRNRTPDPVGLHRQRCLFRAPPLPPTA